MATLNSNQRNNLARSSFAIPSKAPGSGSYPINDARNALSRVSANGSSAQKAQVRAAVHSKYPSIGKSKTQNDTAKAAMQSAMQRRLQ